MQAQSPDLEDSLEEGTATHSSVLAWRISRTQEPRGVWSVGSQRVRHAWRDLAYTYPCLSSGAKVYFLGTLMLSAIRHISQKVKVERGCLGLAGRSPLCWYQHGTISERQQNKNSKGSGLWRITPIKLKTDSLQGMFERWVTWWESFQEMFRKL